MMRAYFNTLFVGILAITSLSAQFSTEVLTPFDFSTNFNDVYVDQSGDGWAVGNCNILARTTDKGGNWEILSAPDGMNFNAVACKPGTDCQTVLLGMDGMVYRSTDGGDSWTEVAITIDDPREFHFLDDNVVILSHSNESLFRSTDDGETWTEIPLDYSYRGTAHFPTNTIGYLFQQSGGPLLKTMDAGITWDSIYQFDANALYGSWLDANTGFLYDQNRHVFKTTDGGDSWTLVTDTGVPSNIRHMVALSEMELVAHVFPANIFRSTDGGVTWQNNAAIAPDQFGLRYTGIHNIGSEFWVASWNTEILYSDDGILTATSQFPAARPNFERMEFPTNEVGYALQERRGMFKTTDGGNTWSQISNDFTVVSRDFLVLDEARVIIPYNNSGPQITEDGGDTWAPLFPEEIQDTVFVFHIEQLPGGRIYLWGSVHGVYSDDGGDNWNVIYHGHSRFPRSMVFLDDQTGFVGSDGGRIYATNDGGETWTQVADGEFTNQPIANLFALNSTTVLNTVSGSTRCSSDGGMTWDTDSCNGVTAPGQIIVGPDGTYYSGRVSFSSVLPSDIQRSTDQGQSWQSIAGFCAQSVPGAISPDGNYLYAYGSGGFLGRVDLTTVNTEDIRPQDITAAKVHPNPSNGQMWLELTEDRVVTELAVFDLQGRQLWQKTTNVNNPSFDVSFLPNGIYLLRVQGEDWLQTARIVIQK